MLQTYTVDEVLEKLSYYQITNSKQIVRRWLRDGIIEGEISNNRKEGWRITEEELNRFIRKKNPLVARYEEEIACLNMKVQRLEAEVNYLKQELKKSRSNKTF